MRLRLPLLARTWDFLVGTKTRVRRAAPKRPALAVLPLEDRITPDGRPLPLPFVFVGAGSGAPPQVKGYLAETGELAFEKQPFETGFSGRVRVATGDIDRDGIPDLIAAAGPGGGPRVVVYSGKTGNQLAGPLGSFYAYDPAFTGGVYVAGGDVDGDGWHDVITAAGAGGSPHIKVFSGATGALSHSFYAFDTAFRGGATVVSADFTGDGKADLAVGAGAGGGPNVRVFDMNTGDPLPPPLGSFYAFDETFTGGVEVGSDALAGDVTGDGRADLVVGRGSGAGSLVRVFDGESGEQVGEFSPFGSGMTAGVRVSTAFIDDDEFADIVVGTGEGVTGTVKVFSGATFAELDVPMSPYTPFGSSFTGGLFVAASNDPEVPDLMISVSKTTVTRGEALEFTADVFDSDSSNGVQTPTGYVQFFLANVAGTGVNWEEAAILSPVEQDPGHSRATLVMDPVLLEAGVYLCGATFYSGSSEFLWTYAEFGNITVEDVQGDLDIIDSNGNAVAEDKETNPGGWVAVNNDNDNYNFVGEQATSLVQKYDWDEAVKVEGEDDLVGIRVHGLSVIEGVQYRLTYDGGIKVWKSKDKVNLVSSGDIVSDGEEVTLWVEGMQPSDEPRDVYINLGWLSPSGSDGLDSVRFTVYEVAGAMNVPGFSKYNYLAAAQGGEPRFEAVNGIFSVTSGPINWGPAPYANSRGADILWGAGATVGVYRVYPTSADNFFIDRQVNVVKISLATAGDDNWVEYNNPPAQVGGLLERVIHSVDRTQGGVGPAMEPKLRITGLEGPVVLGEASMRGVRFIEFGLIQNVKLTQVHADYDIPNPDPSKRFVWSHEGKLLLDIPAGQSAPWYNINEPTPGSAGGLYSSGTDPAAGAAITSIDLRMEDTPRLPGTAVSSMVLNINGVDRDVSRFAILADYWAYFAVRTKEEGLSGLSAVYTQRAKARWWFNGSGPVVAGVWTGDPGAMDDNIAVGAENDGSPSFESVTDGAVVPVTTGPGANDVVNDPNPSVSFWTLVDKQ